MTDFIARLAARAVGEAAVVQPRLPSRFERPNDGALDVVEEERVVAPVATAHDPAAELPASHGTATAAQEPSPARPSLRRAASPPAPKASSPRGRPVALAREAARAPRASETEVSQATPAAALLPVRPAVVAARPARAPLRAPVPTATRAEEEPRVRVHIGRLEVRANLEQPRPEQPRALEPPKEEGVSLAEYLRGEREPQ